MGKEFCMLLKRKNLFKEGNIPVRVYIIYPTCYLPFLLPCYLTVTNGKISFKINHFLGNCYLVTLVLPFKLLPCYLDVTYLCYPKLGAKWK